MSDYNPGRDAAIRHPDWVIRHRPLRGIPEVMCPKRKVILVETGMHAVDRRCALAHAVAHVDLGHAAVLGPVLEAREELAADVLAATRLVTVEDLGRLDLYGRSFAEVAFELRVTEHILWTRVNAIGEADRAALLELGRTSEWGAA